jgi:hypothetical protein
LVAVHVGGVDEARVDKPGIPTVGLDGIPVHDEIELELELAPYSPVPGFGCRHQN